jgi:hypothetical protein
MALVVSGSPDEPHDRCDIPTILTTEHVVIP